MMRLLEQGVVEAHDDAAGDLRFAGQLVDDQAAILHGDEVLGAAPRRSRCRPSTSAICTPPTWPLEMFALSGLVRDALTPVALALRFVHAEPGAGFLPGPLLLVLRVDDLAGLDRAGLSGWPPTFGATFLNRSSRAACAARSVAGACDGQVVLPPEPVEEPNWLSPILATMSVGCRPRISAATMAVTVRCAVPRSCVEVSAVTVPSRLMVTRHSFGVHRRPRSRPRCGWPCRCRA